jgi:hypothetical protein
MVALLDVNVLVALFDPVHLHHDTVHAWFRRHRKHGWATCPLTENGLVRVLSNPAYPGRRTSLQDAAARLTRFKGSGRQRFWADSISLCDDSLFRLDAITGHRQLTDVYLLGLAVKNGGRLATLDGGIPLAAVAGATAASLALIVA